MENELKVVITKYNNALRKWVVSEYKKLNDSTAQIFMLDTNCLGIISMAIDKNDKLVYKKSGRVEEYNLFINYYWIEYDFVNGKARKKITFYCKDIDCKSGNVHVIPGVIQEWESVDYYNYDYPNIPSIKYDNNKLCMINVPKKAEYKSFIEEGWIPTHCGKDTIMELLDYNRVMPNFLELNLEYSNVINKVRKSINIILNNEAKVKFSSYYPNGKSPKYTIIKWMKINVNEKEYIIAPYDTSFIPKFGFITNYGLLNAFESCANERNDDKISLEYEITPAIEADKTNFYYVKDNNKLLAAQDDYNDAVKYIKQMIKFEN